MPVRCSDSFILALLCLPANLVGAFRCPADTANGKASPAAAPGVPPTTPDLTGAAVRWKQMLGKAQAPDPQNETHRP